MNWSKAKNVLIILFVGLNILLAYMNYSIRVDAFVLNDMEKDHIKKLLSSKNIISSYTEIPVKYFPMRKLEVLPYKMSEEDEKKILSSIFGNTKGMVVSIQSSPEGDQNVYRKGTQQIAFGEREIFYRATAVKKEWVITSEKEAQDAAEDFFKKIGYTSKNMKSDPIRKEGHQYILTYYDMYKDNILFDSYVYFEIGPGGIEKADIYKSKPGNFYGPKKAIYAPDEVLFSFMNHVERPSDLMVIENIQLGYFQEQGVPYYRIQLTNGKNYYINAYTNEMDRD